MACSIAAVGERLALGVAWSRAQVALPGEPRTARPWVRATRAICRSKAMASLTLLTTMEPLWREAMAPETMPPAYAGRRKCMATVLVVDDQPDLVEVLVK